jgi:flavin-dependent dehydrogenase
MRVESGRGIEFRLTYGGTGSLADSAVGMARPGLDELLLAEAARLGAEIQRGARVVGIERVHAGTWTVQLGDGAAIRADVLVGADGRRSTVARRMGVIARPSMPARVGLTFHIADATTATGGEARIVLIRDGYVGLAPVPCGRLNVGIVLGRSWFARLRSESPAGLAAGIVRSVSNAHGHGALDIEILDHVAGASPLAHAVKRRAGPGWLLVGDAAGFLDPFTGEGLHRSLASAELAASAVLAARSDAARSGKPTAGERYETAMRSTFRNRDLVTRIVDGFLARPALFEYAARRLSAREQARDTMGRVIGDLVPAGRALDPRFLASVLRP